MFQNNEMFLQRTLLGSLFPEISLECRDLVNQNCFLKGFISQHGGSINSYFENALFCGWLKHSLDRKLKVELQ